MKGWVPHGVCVLEDWQKIDIKSERLMDTLEKKGKTVTISDLARAKPGGAFYRDNHRDVRDMHAALAGVGILYCTLMVHDGWDKPGPDRVDVEGCDRFKQLPLITRQGRAEDGHAIALVGYT